MTLKELAALLRSGEAKDGPIADYQKDYRKAAEVFWKKDD